MNHEILHITNGDCFNEYFLSKHGGKAVPFCEAMMDGKATAEIYSEEFILLRAKELKVSPEEYRSKMHVYEALQEKAYAELHLWFGKDTFCQINLLTLLAYLEQMGFDGRVIFHAIDDENFEEIGSEQEVQLGIYRNIYEEILIRGQAPEETGILDAGAVVLYFDYHAENGMLSRLVRENKGMDRMALICLLLENSRAYGLSDIQAEQLIDAHGTAAQKN